jgi:DNA-binding beta-propeller fold protein YncE
MIKGFSMEKIKFFRIGLIIASVLSFGSYLHALENISQKKIVTKKSTTPTKLIKKWETRQRNQLDTPESVLYDRSKKKIYVSNVNSSKSKKHWIDNDGFISKLNKNGTIDTLVWVSGLKAPKGLAVHKNHLYVADINSVVKIDTINGVIEDIFYAPKGVNHLNDLVYDKKRNVLYVSDSSSKKIFKMTLDGRFKLFYKKERNKPRQNGLYIYNDKLIMQGNRGKLKSLSLKTYKRRTISKTIFNANIDGIWRYKNMGYLVSDWQGKIYFVSKRGKAKLLLTTKPIRSADISYSSALGLLLVPDFNDRIIAYRVK